MAKGDWWLKLEIHTWMNDPCLRRLSRADRDSWLTACMLMHLEGDCSLSGTPDELMSALHLGHTDFWNFVKALQSSKTANVTSGHDFVTLTSRRYERELNIKEGNKLRKQAQRERVDVTPKSRDRVISKKKEVRSKSKKEGESAAIAATPIDPNFEPSPAAKSAMASECPNVDFGLETKNFIDHYLGNGEKGKDWLARWRKWIRNQHKWQAERKPKPAKADESDMLSPHYKPPETILTFDMGMEGETDVTPERYEELKQQWREYHPDRAEQEIAEYERGSDYRKRFSQAEPNGDRAGSANGRSSGNGIPKAEMPLPRGQASFGGDPTIRAG